MPEVALSSPNFSAVRTAGSRKIRTSDWVKSSYILRRENKNLVHDAIAAVWRCTPEAGGVSDLRARVVGRGPAGGRA